MVPFEWPLKTVVTIFLLVVKILHRWAVPVFLRKLIATYDFPGGGGVGVYATCPPSGSAHARTTKPLQNLAMVQSAKKRHCRGPFLLSQLPIQFELFS